MKKLTFAQYIIDMLAERYRLNAENPVKNYEAVTENADILHDFEEVGKTFTIVPTWCGVVKQLETAVNAPLDSSVLGSVLYEFGLVSPDLNIDNRYVGYNRERIVKWRYSPANKFSLVMIRLACIRKELDNCLYRLEKAVKDFSDDAGNILDEKERRFDRISAPLLSALYGGFEDIQELLTRSEDTESEEAKALQSRLEAVHVSAEKWLATHPEKFPEPEKTTAPFEEERRKLEYDGTFCTVSRYENGKYTGEVRKERSARTYSALIKYFYNKIVSARETMLTVDSETGLNSAVSTLQKAYKAIKALQGVTAEKYHVFKAKKPDVKEVSAPVQRFEVGKLYQITKTGAVEIVEISGSSAKITWAKIKPECKAVKIAVVDGVEVFTFGRWTVKANKEFTTPEPEPTAQEEESAMNENTAIDNIDTIIDIMMIIINILYIGFNDVSIISVIDNHDNTPSGKTLKALFDGTEDEPEEVEDSGEWVRPQPTEDHTSPTEPPTAEPHETTQREPENVVQPSVNLLEMPLTIYPDTDKATSTMTFNFNMCFYSFTLPNIRQIAKMAEFSDKHHGTNAVDIMVANAIYYQNEAEKHQNMTKYYFCGKVLSVLQKVSPEIEKRNKVLLSFCNANKATKDHDSTLISDYFPSENIHVIGNRFIVFAISGQITNTPTSQPERAANFPEIINTEITREKKIPLDLPSVSALSKYISSEKKLQTEAERKAHKAVFYDFGEKLPLVNAEFLLMCMQVLTDCQLFSVGEFAGLSAIGSDGSKCCMMPLKVHDGYTKHKTDLTAFEKKTSKRTKKAEPPANSAVSPTDTAEETPEPVKEVSALDSMKTKSIKFFWNGIKINDGDLIKCSLRLSYQMEINGKIVSCSSSHNSALPENTVFNVDIYADSYGAVLPRDVFAVTNDTDSMTDYFDKDHTTVTPEHPLYNYVLSATIKSEIRTQKGTIKSIEKRLAKCPERLKEMYQNELDGARQHLQQLEAMQTVKGHPTIDDLVKVAEMDFTAISKTNADDHEKAIAEREKELTDHHQKQEEQEKLVDKMITALITHKFVEALDESQRPNNAITMSVDNRDEIPQF